MLTVGIPKEVKNREKRVALTPEAVRCLTSESGARVCVESGAGTESGFTDALYKSAGAEILPDAASLYSAARLIVKVKEPQPQEFALLGKNHVLFSFLHLASPEGCQVVDALCRSNCAAIAFETIEVNGQIPVLRPMSIIAGALGAAYGTLLLDADGLQGGDFIPPSGFLGKLEEIAEYYPRVPALKAGSTVIWGGGTAGTKAAEFLLAMQGEVTVVELSAERRKELYRLFENNERFKSVSPEDLDAAAVRSARMWLGCVHVPGQRALKVLTDEAFAEYSRELKKIAVDIAIDQGGNFPDSRATTYDEPLYRDKFGNVRFSVANIPSLSGPAASRELEKVLLPYVQLLARGLDAALETSPELRDAVNIRKGKVVHEAVKKAHQR